MEKFKPEKKVFSVCKTSRVNKTEPNEEREVYLSMPFLSPLFPRPCCDFVSEFVAASFADWLEAIFTASICLCLLAQEIGFKLPPTLK